MSRYQATRWTKYVPLALLILALAIAVGTLFSGCAVSRAADQIATLLPALPAAPAATSKPAPLLLPLPELRETATVHALQDRAAQLAGELAAVQIQLGLATKAETNAKREAALAPLRALIAWLTWLGIVAAIAGVAGYVALLFLRSPIGRGTALAVAGAGVAAVIVAQCVGESLAWLPYLRWAFAALIALPTLGALVWGVRHLIVGGFLADQWSKYSQAVPVERREALDRKSLLEQQARRLVPAVDRLLGVRPATDVPAVTP